MGAVGGFTNVNTVNSPYSAHVFTDDTGYAGAQSTVQPSWTWSGGASSPGLGMGMVFSFNPSAFTLGAFTGFESQVTNNVALTQVCLQNPRHRDRSPHYGQMAGMSIVGFDGGKHADRNISGADSETVPSSRWRIFGMGVPIDRRK